MFKVTIILFFIVQSGCNRPASSEQSDDDERQINKDAESRIDSAYIAINKRCDSLFTYAIPLKVDSVLKTDTLK